jgi:hypothetical protein
MKNMYIYVYKNDIFMNNFIFDFVILIILTLILYLKNNQLIHFLNTNLGRFIFIIIVIILSVRHILLGIIALVLFFIFRERYYIEGLDSKDGLPLLVNVNEVPLDGSITIKNIQTTVTNETLTKKTTDLLTPSSDTSLSVSDVSDQEKQNNAWRKQNCSQDNLPIFNNQIVSKNDLSKVFKNFSFINESCNPCDSECKFKVTSSSDSTSFSDSMKPISSNALPTSTARFGNGSQSAYFSKLDGTKAGAGMYTPSFPNPLSDQPSNLVTKTAPNANKYSPAVAPPPISSIANMPK